MHYVRQTVTISHYIAADSSITEEVQKQIAAEVRLLLKTKGINVVNQIGESISNQASRNEEIRTEILVNVTNEYITDAEMVLTDDR